MKNPYRAGSLNAKIFGVLLASKVPSTVAVIARQTRMPQETVARVLAALKNPLHNSVARRAGVCVLRKGEGFIVKKVKAEKNAKRPRKPARKAKKKSKKKAR